MLSGVITFFGQSVRLSWADVIDMIIVAYIIYKAIILVKETRAVQLVKGIGIMLIALQVSEWLQFNTINFILKNTMQVGVVAVLVVFQPELRRALEQVGRSSLGSVFKFENIQGEDWQEKIIAEICDAAGMFSRSKTGALIVVERETKLGDIIATGTVIDAIVDSRLLQNIFFINSPLHDGAVVVRNSRILAANCYLPLTNDASLSHELGTRHRAAVGMSEICDAIVLVVSEETGKISIALNGNLTRNLTTDSLSKALKRLLIEEKETKKGKKKSLIKKVTKQWEKS